jgi:hypothetical protein
LFDLRYQLADTGLYNLGDPVSSGELRAYERQLNDLLAWQQQMKREMALDTTELLIQRWEKIYKTSPEPSDSIRDRQIKLLNKRRAKGVLTPSKVIAFAADFNYQAKVIKQVRPFRYRVDLGYVDTLDIAKLDEILINSEPGHQAHEFGIEQLVGRVEHLTTPSEPLVYVSKYLICNTFEAGGEWTL